MIRNDHFYEALRNNGVGFFCGVPDSLLKEFCGFLSNEVDENKHIIAANEGGAVALASGYQLATGKLPFVYMQNSGLGNAINPLLSLADPDVYSIPMLVLIGWRGEPGVKDEPQHRKQGRVQNAMLDAMEIPYVELKVDTPDVENLVKKAAERARKDGGPVAILVRKNTFESNRFAEKESNDYTMTREDAIAFILEHISPDDILVSTTGKPSREVYEIREAKGDGHQRDFLTVGSMGHSSQIALGIAMNSRRNVYCLDGDGSVIMHMGSLCITGCNAPDNFRHVVLNNGAHDSVGGQPTVAFDISIPGAAKGCGYRNVYSVSTAEELKTQFRRFQHSAGPALMEIRVKKGARQNLGRPSTSPAENKRELMKLLTHISHD